MDIKKNLITEKKGDLSDDFKEQERIKKKPGESQVWLSALAIMEMCFQESKTIQAVEIYDIYNCVKNFTKVRNSQSKK